MLGKILYLPLYWIGHIWFKINLISMGVKVWPRNSYYFNRVIPLKSDIDLTLFFVKKLQINQFNKIRKCHIQLKRLLPIFSELNLYDPESNLEFINPFELNRDPLLKENINYQHLTPTPAHKIVFLLRMLLADRHNLQKNPKSRMRKWRGHFYDCSLQNFPQENFSLNSLLDILRTEVFVSMSLDHQKFLENYLTTELSSDKIINEFYLSHLTDLKYFILTAPARWVGASLSAGRIDEDLKVIKQFSDLEKQILINHIKWEHWGIETQRHLNFDDSSVVPHLFNLDKIANEINN